MTLADASSSGTIKALRVLIIAALIIPALILATTVWRDRQAILAGEEKDAAKLLAVYREQAENLFKGHNIILDLIVERMRNRDWDTLQGSPEILRELESIDKMLDDTSAILLVDATGKTRLSTIHLRKNDPLPLADQSCFHALQRGASKTCISEPYFDPVSAQHLFSLTRSLDKDGLFHGMAQVAISADYIMALWASALPHPTDAISLIRSDGVILAQPPSHPGARAAYATIGASLIAEIEERSSSMSQTRRTVERGDRTIVFGKITGYPVYIAIGVDYNAILAVWHRHLTVYGLIAVFAALGIILALRTALKRAHEERRVVAQLQKEMHERETAEEQLRQSQKMESLGKLTGGIAHDFNNLLTVIVGNVGMVERAIREPDHKRQLRNALRSGESAIELTQRLLTFSRKQPLHPQSVDMQRLVEGMHDLMLRTMGADIRVVIKADDKLWPTIVDPNQMESVILNLAINARDAMPNGGTLAITMTNADFVRNAPEELAMDQYVVLTVADTGIGMDEVTLARATEPFFTTKEQGKGTGLGLSLMQGVVSQSGGATRLRSSLGEGTQVEVWLPRAAQTSPARDTACDQPRRLTLGDESILVCDDNADLREFLCDALNALGYRTTAAEDGKTALSILRSDRSIRLLIVDFAMPEMSGGTVIRHVRAQQPSLPILLITGNAEPEMVQAEAPGVSMLLKPFKQEQLGLRVGELLRKIPVAA